MIFAVTVVQSWHVKQIDFIIAFLNELLFKTVYMIQSIDYEEGLNLICKLNQDLYDLKQSSRIWYKTLTDFLQELDFTSNKWDIKLWFHKTKQIYITFYVDDFKLIKLDKSILNFINQQISAWFNIQNLEHIHHYLRMKMKQNHEIKTIHLSQEIYIKNLLKQHEMKNCHAVSISI